MSKTKKQDWRGEKGKYFDCGYNKALKEVERIIDKISFDFDISRTQDEGTHCMCGIIVTDILKKKLKELEIEIL